MKKFRLLIIAIIFILIGFILAPMGLLSTPKNILFEGLKPFTIVANFTVDKVAMFFGNLQSLGSLSSDNQKLIKENLELQSQLAILKEVQHENEILKKEMGFLNTKGDLKLIPANIVGRSISGYLKTIIIDRGEKDGLKQGQAIVSQGFLVGTVKTVFPDTAEVILITDNNSLVPVILQDSRGTGLLRGGLSGLTIENVPLNIPINKGEQIITSGLGGDVPPGIMVGTAEEVVSREGEIFQKVTVKSPVQIYFLEFVFAVEI